MESAQLVGEITVDVNYGPKSFSLTKENHRLPFKGKGQLSVRGDTISLHGQTGRPFGSAKNVTMTFSASQIANFFIDQNQVQFSVYPSGVFSGRPLYICILRTNTQEDAQRICAALPQTITEDIKQLITDQDTFLTSVAQVIRFPFCTLTILVINVVVFIIMVVFGVGIFEPSIESLMRWGANFGLFTIGGEWWRLITSAFVHIGIIHLALNMWVLNDVGELVEGLYGHTLFIFIYLASGIMGSMVSLGVNPEVVSAGASGAIFGLYGALLGFSVRQKHAIPNTVLKNLRNSSIGFIAYNVFYGFAMSGIDNAAHLGGLACGAILGFITAMPFDLQIRKTVFFKRMKLSMGAFAVLVVASMLFVLSSSSFPTFYVFYATEEAKAINAYNLTILGDGRLNDVEAANKLEIDCLGRWVAIYDKGKKVNLPQSSIFKENLKLLMQVASLRIESLRKVIDSLRKNDENLLKDAVLIGQQADQLIENANTKSR